MNINQSQSFPPYLFNLLESFITHINVDNAIHLSSDIFNQTCQISLRIKINPCDKIESIL